MSDFGKCLHSKKSRFGSFYTVETTYFALFVLFKKHDFELKKIQRVRFWIEKTQRVRF